MEIVGVTNIAKWLHDHGKAETQVHRHTIERWIKAGILPAERKLDHRGHPWAATVADLEAFAPPTPGGRVGAPKKGDE